MADLNALCVALAANLAAISGLQETPYALSNPTPPTAEIEPGKADYHKAMQDGLYREQFIVRVFVSLTADIGGQKRLYGFMADSGAGSIKQAIESDCTLGGLADDLIVTGRTGPMRFLREVSGAAGRGSASGLVLGAEWTVDVLVSS